MVLKKRKRKRKLNFNDQGNYQMTLFFSWQNSTSIGAGWKLEMSDKLLILQFDRSIFSHCQFLSSVTLTLEDTAVTRQR